MTFVLKITYILFDISSSFVYIYFYTSSRIPYLFFYSHMFYLLYQNTKKWPLGAHSKYHKLDNMTIHSMYHYIFKTNVSCVMLVACITSVFPESATSVIIYATECTSAQIFFFCCKYNYPCFL